LKSIVNTIKDLEIPKSGLWISEAEFGFKNIKEYCQNLEIESSVLEVGCGSGILLSMFSEEFCHLNFEGIEPYSEIDKNLLAV